MTLLYFIVPTCTNPQSFLILKNITIKKSTLPLKYFWSQHEAR